MAKRRKNQRKVTSASLWRRKREQGEIIELPSGLVARLRAVSLDVMVSQGDIPDLLTPLAAQTLWRDISMDDIAEDAALAQGYTDLINQVVPAAFVEPKVAPAGEEPGDDEIALSDISWQDKTHIFQLVLLPTEAIERFREKQEADVGDLPDGEGQPLPPEPAAED